MSIREGQVRFGAPHPSDRISSCAPKLSMDHNLVKQKIATIRSSLRRRLTVGGYLSIISSSRQRHWLNGLKHNVKAYLVCGTPLGLGASGYASGLGLRPTGLGLRSASLGLQATPSATTRQVALRATTQQVGLRPHTSTPQDDGTRRLDRFRLRFQLRPDTAVFQFLQ